MVGISLKYVPMDENHHGMHIQIIDDEDDRPSVESRLLILGLMEVAKNDLLRELERKNKNNDSN